MLQLAAYGLNLAYVLLFAHPQFVSIWEQPSTDDQTQLRRVRIRGYAKISLVRKICIENTNQKWSIALSYFEVVTILFDRNQRVERLT